MWDDGTAVEETLSAFNDLVRCGKIRYYGFSNVSGWQMQKIVDTAKTLNLEPCISLQVKHDVCFVHLNDNHNSSGLAFDLDTKAD